MKIHSCDSCMKYFDGFCTVKNTIIIKGDWVKNSNINNDCPYHKGDPYLTAETVRRIKAKGDIKLYICTNHEGYWDVGVSIILARNEIEAGKLLETALKKCGLRLDNEISYEFVEIDMSEEQAIVLNDGDY